MRVILTVKFVPEPNALLSKSECGEFRELMERTNALNGFGRPVDLRWLYVNNRGDGISDISVPVIPAVPDAPV